MSNRTIDSGTRVSGHPLAFSVMRMCGVDPVAAMTGKAVWPEDHVPDYVEEDGGVLRMRMSLDRSGQVRMTINGGEACVSARGQTLPDTALMAAPGLPLKSVVEHVLLTNAPYRVREAVSFDADEEGIGTNFHLDGQPLEFVVP